MSKGRRKRERTAPMPAVSAGLLRFFEEETKGVKVRPELVIALTVGLLIAVILARIMFPV